MQPLLPNSCPNYNLRQYDTAAPLDLLALGRELFRFTKTVDTLGV